MFKCSVTLSGVSFCSSLKSVNLSNANRYAGNDCQWVLNCEDFKLSSPTDMLYIFQMKGPPVSAAQALSVTKSIDKDPLTEVSSVSRSGN